MKTCSVENLKFYVELTREAFDELKKGLVDVETMDEGDSNSEVIRQLFYVDLGIVGDIDVRDQVIVREESK